MPDIPSILAQMTLEEKAALCTGASSWSTTPVPRLGIPELICSDGPHGVRRVPDIYAISSVSLPATCFPTASCLAATWDVELIHQMGAALAAECIALDVDVLLGPGANMKRSPLCGRNFEYYSEDPYLAGEMAASLIQGVQSLGVGTSLKHFAANNQEFHRFSINALVGERALHEIYLPAFEKAVRQAQPWTVMCAYNRLNGTYCSEHHDLLVKILKEAWGFEGLVVSDWSAVHDRVAALKGGLDLEMPGPQERRVQAVVDAVTSGTLDEDKLNEAVRRILRIVFMAAATPKDGTFDAAAHHALAQKVASEGMVLLKNDGLLPLQPGSQRIAVIGRAAEEAHIQGGGSSHINPTRVDVPIAELKARAGAAELTFAPGYPADDAFRQDLIDQAAAQARAADVAVLYIALPDYKESEGYDRPDLDLTHQQVALIQAVSAVQPRTVVVLNNGAAVAMSSWIGAVPAVLEAYMMGQGGGGAIADLLFGKINPSGKLAETFPLKMADIPAYLNWPGEAGEVRYGEGLFIGYRYYDAKQMPVLFPFGHGLSYTTFAYGNPRASAAQFKDVDGLAVSVEVTNTGSMAGAEVVQVYVHDRQSSLVRPPRELKGFARVYLQPGETQTVTIPLDFRAFAFYHPEYRQWITEDGAFDILIGASSADIRHVLTVTLQSSLELPCILDEESTLREWMADRRGKLILAPLVNMIETYSRQAFGESAAQEGGSGLGMDIMDMIGDMPLLSVMSFQQAFMTSTPEAFVAALLKQAHAA